MNKKNNSQDNNKKNSNKSQNNRKKGEKMILSDKSIKEELKKGTVIISGVVDNQIGPCSVDLSLDNAFKVFKHADITHVDPKNINREELMSETFKEDNKPFIIHPGEFVLGSTVERVKVPNYLVGRLDGRSSWGRLGIIVHSTAGSVQPGWNGKLTLEIANISKLPVALYPGVKICQISFQQLTTPADEAYHQKSNSKYLNQTGADVTKLGDE